MINFRAPGIFILTLVSGLHFEHLTAEIFRRVEKKFTRQCFRKGEKVRVTSIIWKKTNSSRMEVRAKKDKGSILCEKLIVRVQTAQTYRVPRSLEFISVDMCWISAFTATSLHTWLLGYRQIYCMRLPYLDILLQLILIKLTTFWRGALYRIENQFISMNYTIIHFLDAVFSISIRPWQMPWEY